MTNRKNTKRALFSSVISLILCLSMLIGTTFAWFTDSVSSGVNQIVAGNLDVDVYYGDPADEQSIAGVNTLFNDVTRWEPGAMAWEQLTVVNLGSLALKYNMSVNFANATDNGNGKTLADVLQVAVMSELPTREGVQNAALVPMKDFALGLNDQPLLKGESKGFYMAIYWEPSADDNEYNLNNDRKDMAPLSIDLGINLVATQYTKESDSFNDQYDVTATYPVATTVAADGNKDVQITAGEVSVTVPAGVAAGDYTLEVANKNETTDENGNVTVAFDINLLKDGVKVEPDGVTVYPVEIFVGKQAKVAGVTHKGEPVADYSYDLATGVVSFETASFSPFAVTFKQYENYPVESVEELAQALAVGGAFKLTEDLQLTEALNVEAGKTVILDLAGKNITAGDDGYIVKNVSGGTLILSDSGNAAVAAGVVYTGTGSKTIVQGGTYSAVEGGSYVFLNYSGSLTIDDAIVNGGSSYPIYSYGDGHELIINDITINGTFGCINAYNAGNVVINDGEFYMTGVKGKTSHIVYISGTTTLTINDGTFKQVGDISMSASGGGGICSAGNAVITINDGDFEGDYRDLYVWSKTSKITVQGGTYAFSPTSEGAKLAEGYKAEKVNGVYMVVTENTVPTDKAEDVKNEAQAGGDVILTDDIETEANTTAPYGNKVGIIQNGGVIDGNGNALIVEGYGDDYGIMTSGGTIKNLTIDGIARAIMIMSPTEDIVLDNVYASGDILYPINTGEHATVEGVDLIVTNSTFGGWSSFAGIDSASFTGCNFINGNYGYGWPYDALVKPYINTTFTNCTFEVNEDGYGYYLDLSALGADCTVTLAGCTVNGTVITADNCTELFGEVELPSGRTIADCLIFS